MGFRVFRGFRIWALSVVSRGELDTACGAASSCNYSYLTCNPTLTLSREARILACQS